MKRLPSRIRRRGSTLLLGVRERLDEVRGRRDPLTPPARIWPQPGSFSASGDARVRLLVERARLEPHERVLDVGCGPGKLGFALARFLDERGRYDGFDVRRDAIGWSRRMLRKAHPRFPYRVFQVDVFNPAYNPSGTVAPSEFRFPYPEASFDVVTLFSVFTHMLPDGIRRYLSEIARVLTPGGRVVSTWFLVEEPSTVTTGGRQLAFVHPFRDFLTIDPAVPEKAVAYSESFARGLLRDIGLMIEEPIRHGRATQPPTDQDSQDVIIARKE
jgi:SAM-dependent methyltransferase